jgi:prepilin-type N-terminal cleavage/methylation domain-containing protein
MEAKQAMNKSKAFTLIELLIVVAIIAILAAIAVPNFLEAQTRAKVSRVKADMRSLANGLESYVVDNRNYPPDPGNGKQPSGLWWGIHLLAPLTSPIAYMTSLPPDPFYSPEAWRTSAGDNAPDWWTNKQNTYLYLNGLTFQAWAPYWEVSKTYLEFSTGDRRAGIKWLLYGAGPDRVFNMDQVYDPTNGTVSRGEIYRWGP